MKKGDKIIITSVADNYDYFYVGDTATLISQNENGDWRAKFDKRHWGERSGSPNDHIFYLQKSVGTQFELNK